MFQDDCTLVEFVYNRNNFDSDVIRDNDGLAYKGLFNNELFGLRIRAFLKPKSLN